MFPARQPEGRESLGAIRAECLSKASAHSTVAAKIRLNTEVISGQVSVVSEANGTYEHQRKGAKLLFRVEMKNQIRTKAGKRVVDDEQAVLTIGDGVHAYTLTHQKGKEPSAVKSMPVASQTLLADEPFFEVLASNFEVRVLPDEKIDAQDVWVLETRPRTPKPGQAAKTLHYIRKDCALRVRSTGHDATGRRIQFSGLSEVKLDPEIDPRRFIFEAPDGVKVMDLTGKP
ncbi:MAG: hypothetical protein DCC65_01280 [Planctomycetota bacterium]|nr:MAG: hypothetical protein DCC65_01280 [Planctomycetota bacterium]